MTPVQGEVVPMATKSELNEENLELTRLFHQIKKTLSILTFNELTDEGLKPVLYTFAGYVPNHESPPF